MNLSPSIKPESLQSKTSSDFRWLDADAYLFDIDGTLLVTKDLVHWNALNTAMLEVYGVDTTIEGIAYHGKTDLGILRAALERMGITGKAFEDKLPQALDAICRDVASHADEIVPHVCPSISEVLNKLKDCGKLLGVASGNLESVGWKKIEKAALRDFFTFGCFSDQNEMRSDIFRAGVSEVKRRLGNNAKTYFVGDTPEDVKAARYADAPIIAVGTGIFTADKLAANSPDLCISCCTDLLSLKS
jgi:phosphoglycolate phosphatase-like HAD superfamily hydrolase